MKLVFRLFFGMDATPTNQPISAFLTPTKCKTVRDTKNIHFGKCLRIPFTCTNDVSIVGRYLENDFDSRKCIHVPNIIIPK